MNKIGLLTFHKPINYGAILQAVALSKSIEKYNATCEIIDYRNPSFNKAYPILHLDNCKTLKTTIWELLMIPRRIITKVRFRSFLYNNVRLSRRYNKKGLNSIEGKYNAIIVGSDQVWNLKCTGNDTTYFLDFVHFIPKYSYAASFGDFIIDDTNREAIKKYINSYNAISVREHSGIEIIKELCGLDCIQTLDPTLLLRDDEWRAIASNDSKLIHDKYILIYFMVQTPESVQEIFKLANRIKTQYKYKIVVIGGSLRKNKDGIIYYNVSSPEEFIRLFKDASYVLTSSFHGTAFSIIFNKNFFSYVKPNLLVQGRIDNLLSTINLKNRAFSKADEIDEIMDVDFTEPNHLLEERRQYSTAYLKKVIES